MSYSECPACKTPVYELTDKFCRNCATNLTGMHSKCTGCCFSAIMPEDVNYCPMCGQPRATFWEPSPASLSAQVPA